MVGHDASAKGETDLQELLDCARNSGLLMYTKAGRLIVVGPKPKNTNLLDRLQLAKAELISHLRADLTDGEHFEERAAIAEYDGELSRAEAETLAWGEWSAAIHRRSNRETELPANDTCTENATGGI